MGFDWWQNNCLFSTVYKPGMGSPWVPEDFSLQMKQLGREANHSPSANAKIRNVCVPYLHCPKCLCGVVILEFKISLFQF